MQLAYISSGLKTNIHQLQTQDERDLESVLDRGRAQERSGLEGDASLDVEEEKRGLWDWRREQKAFGLGRGSSRMLEQMNPQWLGWKCRG